MSKIEWTDAVWNPTTGCNKVSRGCKHCYAEVMHKRLMGMKIPGYDRPFLDGAYPNHTALGRPFKWKTPRKVFVNSMSDLFHVNIPFEYIDRVFDVMRSTPQHTYQILTKRPERMAEYLNVHRRMRDTLPNVWLGTSVEDQQSANERMPHLLNCPAAVRFLSMEPLVGPVDLLKEYPTGKGSVSYGALMDWVIVGGESGNKAVPMHPEWVRSIRNECAAADVPFFFKQWGNWCPPDQYPFKAGSPDIARCQRHVFPDGVEVYMAGKSHTGNTLDGKQHLQFPKQ